MTATPPDPFATQYDSTTDPDATAPVDDAQTQRLREENRALRELLAAQVQAIAPTPPPAKSGCLRRIGWALISAPGAALVGWRALFWREDAPPMTGRRVGSATLTVLYTLAIYAALVLLVVSWNAPNNGIAGPGTTGAVSSGRVPLTRLPLVPANEAPSDWDTSGPPPVLSPRTQDAPTANPEPDKAPHVAQAAPAPAAPEETGTAPADGHTSESPAANDASGATSAAASSTTSTAPQPTLHITEIPAENPLAWVDTLKDALARCAELGFFERPNCAWEARRQFCEPNQGWGVVKECPARP
ncbi:hypothetical protein [Achromobacter spanius]|uniref:Phage tail protein n=1 Tax=Achromobacter spanius TaxID=217203 RepID=A0AAW3I0V2_9BURK|nr:hypothetical protein [Achromobacter spanius]KNE25531.1 hypothetical protein AFM18_21855 [Achromobacter spanius]